MSARSGTVANPSHLASVITGCSWLGLCLLAGCGPVLAERELVLVDNSGSTAGFFQTGAMAGLVGRVVPVLGAGDVSIAVFNQAAPVFLSSLDDPRFAPTSQGTSIDAAVRGVIENGRTVALWLVTDNVQNDGDTRYGDYGGFYAQLQRTEVKRVYVFPFLLSFHGYAYVPSESGLRARRFSGSKGLLMYAMCLSDPFRNQFEREVAAFCRVGQSTGLQIQRLLIKPLGGDAASLEPSKMQVLSRSGIPKPLNPGSEEVMFPSGATQVAMDVKVHWGVPYLRLTREARVSGALELLPGGADRALRPAFNVTVKPQLLPPMEPGAEAPAAYRATVTLRSAQVLPDLASIWHAATHSYAVEKRELCFRLEVPDGALSFTDALLSRYGTNDLYDFCRIYGFGALPQLVTTGVTSVPVRQEVRTKIRYPMWPILLFLGMALVLIVICVLLARVVPGTIRQECVVDDAPDGKEHNITLWLAGQVGACSAGDGKIIKVPLRPANYVDRNGERCTVHPRKVGDHGSQDEPRGSTEGPDDLL